MYGHYRMGKGLIKVIIPQNKSNYPGHDIDDYIHYKNLIVTIAMFKELYSISDGRVAISN